jgi:hypothetical protein
MVVVVACLYLGMTVFNSDPKPPPSPIADMLGPDGTPTAPFPVFTLTRRATATPTAGGSAGPGETVSPGGNGPPGLPTPTPTPTPTPVRTRPPAPTPTTFPGAELASLVGRAFLNPLPVPGEAG